jgi:hypothetical protein
VHQRESVTQGPSPAQKDPPMPGLYPYTPLPVDLRPQRAEVTGSPRRGSDRESGTLLAFLIR